MKTNTLVLTKESSITAIRAYFEFVSSLNDTPNGEFPIDFDTVWPLAYASKQKATDSLKGVSTEGSDYQIFNQKGKNPNSHNNGGRPTEKYMLSVPTLEWFIARRVPAVFEVYRQVFHQVRKQAMHLQAVTLPIVPTELAERVGSPLLIDGRMYWPYRRVLQTLGYKRPGSRFYKKAAARNMQLDLFDSEKEHDYKIEYGMWYCSGRVFEEVRKDRNKHDRRIAERQIC